MLYQERSFVAERDERTPLDVSTRAIDLEFVKITIQPADTCSRCPPLGGLQLVQSLELVWIHWGQTQISFRDNAERIRLNDTNTQEAAGLVALFTDDLIKCSSRDLDPIKCPSDWNAIFSESC